MHEPLSLRRNFSWTLAGNIIYFASQFGILIILAKLGTTQMVGRFSFGLAICAPVMIFANMALRPVQATDAKREYLFCDYLGLRLITTFLALLVIATISFIGGYGKEISLVILIVGIAKAFEAISDVYYGPLQQHERMDRIAKSLMIKGPLALIIVGLLIWLTGDLIWGVIGLATARGIILLGYDIRADVWTLTGSKPSTGIMCSGATDVPERLKPHCKMGKMARLAWLALPLAFATMLASLTIYIPYYFVEHYMGVRSLGIFSALAYLMIAANMVTTALGQSSAPRLAQYNAALNDTAFRNLILKLLTVGGAIGATGFVIALVFGRDILTLLYQAEYAKHVTVFVWIIAASAIENAATFFGFGMTAGRLFRIQPFLFSGSALLAAGSCYFLIPRFGLQGAAWTFCLVAIFRFASMGICNVYIIHNIRRQISKGNIHESKSDGH